MNLAERLARRIEDAHTQAAARRERRRLTPGQRQPQHLLAPVLGEATGQRERETTGIVGVDLALEAALAASPGVPAEMREELRRDALAAPFGNDPEARPEPRVVVARDRHPADLPRPHGLLAVPRDDRLAGRIERRVVHVLLDRFRTVRVGCETDRGLRAAALIVVAELEPDGHLSSSSTRSRIAPATMRLDARSTVVTSSAATIATSL